MKAANMKEKTLKIGTIKIFIVLYDCHLTLIFILYFISSLWFATDNFPSQGPGLENRSTAKFSNQIARSPHHGPGCLTHEINGQSLSKELEPRMSGDVGTLQLLKIVLLHVRATQVRLCILCLCFCVCCLHQGVGALDSNLEHRSIGVVDAIGANIYNDDNEDNDE